MYRTQEECDSMPEKKTAHYKIITDNHCDECGYIMVKEVTSEETTASSEGTAADTGHEDEKTSKNNSEPSNWMIILISCFGGIIAICGVVLAVVLRPSKKKRQV